MTGEGEELAVWDAEQRSLSCDAVVVMGVSGSGKTTVGAALAQRLGWPHLDGDDFHPQDNIDKMSAGIPLTDADREPWLKRLGDELDRRAAVGEPVVLACSALKRSYRDILRSGSGAVGLVYLKVGRAELVERLAGRSGHFFPAALIDSQLDTLEEPGREEHALTVAATARPDEIVEDVIDAW